MNSAALWMIAGTLAGAFLTINYHLGRIADALALLAGAK